MILRLTDMILIYGGLKLNNTMSYLNLKCYNNAFIDSKITLFKEKYAPLFGFYQC